MRRFLLFLFVSSLSLSASAQVEPLQVTLGEMVEDIACTSDPTQTYTLYVPSTFTSDRRWPVLLVFDPRGRSLLAAELFREAAETHGWIIVSSDNTRSDGPMEPNTIALQALWPEIHERLPTDFDRVYAAGFSGGAAVAKVLSKATEGLAGILACGGRYFPEYLDDNDVAIFSTAGLYDFNYREMHQVDDFLAKNGGLHRIVVFDGPHAWMPPEVAAEAIEWFELVAMRQGLRDIDPQLVATLFAADQVEAEALAADERAFDAARRYREIVQTYEGMVDTATVRSRVAKIEKSDAYREQAKAVKKSSAYERRCDEGVNNGLSDLRSADIPPPLAQLVRDFKIDDLKERAEKGGSMGRAAQRCLNGLYTGVAFYIPRDAAAERNYPLAAATYEVAVEIREDNPVAWYNLACMRSRLGRGEMAIEALERALETGFNNPDLLATDEDLDALRERDDFKRLLVAVPN
jgi:predicted esterase